MVFIIKTFYLSWSQSGRINWLPIVL